MVMKRLEATLTSTDISIYINDLFCDMSFDNPDDAQS